MKFRRQSIFVYSVNKEKSYLAFFAFSFWLKINSKAHGVFFLSLNFIFNDIFVKVLNMISNMSMYTKITIQKL